MHADLAEVALGASAQAEGGTTDGHGAVHLLVGAELRGADAEVEQQPGNQDLAT